VKGGFINRFRPYGSRYIVALDPETGLEPPIPAPELRTEEGELVELSGEGPYRLARGPTGWTLQLGSATFELCGPVELHQVLVTPAYTAPEQVEPEPGHQNGARRLEAQP
jgi:hypothetical protein